MRRAAAANPNTPDSTLRTLVADVDALTARAAQRQLIRRVVQSLANEMRTVAEELAPDWRGTADDLIDTCREILRSVPT